MYCYQERRKKKKKARETISLGRQISELVALFPFSLNIAFIILVTSNHPLSQWTFNRRLCHEGGGRGSWYVFFLCSSMQFFYQIHYVYCWKVELNTSMLLDGLVHTMLCNGPLKQVIQCRWYARPCNWKFSYTMDHRSSLSTFQLSIQIQYKYNIWFERLFHITAWYSRFSSH